MTDSIATVRPATDAALAGWTLTGGASASACLADDSDASWADAGASVGGQLRLTMASVVLSGNDRLRHVQPWIRAATPDSVARTVAVRLSGVGANRRAPEQVITMTGTPTLYYLLPFRAWGSGRSFNVTDLAALELGLREASTPVGALRVYEAGVDIVYNAAPTVVLDTVTSPITATGLVTGSWVYADAESDAQVGYTERIYERPGGTWPGGSTGAVVAALEAAGVEPVSDVTEVGDATETVPVLLPPVGNFRRFVRVRDAAAGGGYGLWASQEWDMAVVDPPNPPAMAALPDPAHARMVVTLTPAPGSSLDTFDIERSTDGGVSWEALAPGGLDFVPTGPNRLNDGSFLVDTDGDGYADGWAPVSTGTGTPTGTLVAGGQQVTWATNTGTKGVSTRPRVGPDDSNTWPADSLWVLVFEWAGGTATNTLLPVITFDTGTFGVLWLLQPDVSTGAQVYMAEITAPPTAVTTDLRIVSTAGSGSFVINHAQLVDAALVGVGAGTEGSYGGSAYAMGAAYGGSTGEDTSTVPEPPEYAAREDVVIAVLDRCVPRRAPVQYRGRTAGRDAAGVDWTGSLKASAWATTAPVTLDNDGNAWLHSSVDAMLDMAVCLVGLTLSLTSHEDQAGFWAEGRRNAIVVSGTLHAEAPSNVVLALENDEEWAGFRAIQATTAPVLLRTLYGEDPLEDHWIRMGADTAGDRIGGYGAEAMRLAQLRQASFPAWPVGMPRGLTFVRWLPDGSAFAELGTWTAPTGVWSCP